MRYCNEIIGSDKCALCVWGNNIFKLDVTCIVANLAAHKLFILKANKQLPQRIHRCFIASDWNAVKNFMSLYKKKRERNLPKGSWNRDKTASWSNVSAITYGLTPLVHIRMALQSQFDPACFCDAFTSSATGYVRYDTSEKECGRWLTGW